MNSPQPDPDGGSTPAKTRDLADQSSTAVPALPAHPGSPADPQTPPRRVGPYVLNTLLGSGGFGDVWLATREGELAHTRLAVKLPHPDRVDLAAVRQEAALWARIGSHPNILPIFEASVYDGQMVIASEYAPGGSLAESLKGHGGNAIPEVEAIRLTLGVLAGLEHLHALGVVHRDIKPANVLLQNGVPRLADFGISRALHDHSPTDRPAGTPAYMAPEAFDGVRSPRTDLWSVGVLFYQLLTGVLPFPEREWTALLKAILTRDPLPVPPAVGVKFDNTLRKSLAKDPAERYRSAGHMAAEIRAAATQPGTSSAIRVQTHVAFFVGTRQPALFANVTNMSEMVDREVTHVWIEAEPKIYIENERRPLPKRLRPQETWETWIEWWKLPPVLLNEGIFRLVRVRLSTGETVVADRNVSVPESGWVPGEPRPEHPGPDVPPIAPVPPRAPRKRWWFW